MTLTLKDIKHLEVMAGLSNAKPIETPKVNIKELITENIIKNPSLDEKIISLCCKLRDSGFDKQANGLEEKFITYKSASTHLYKAFEEDGEDLINSAHPEGEVKIEDAADDLGKVETILTEHKKLVNVVNKVPTGKLASFKLNKNADNTVVLSDIGKKFKYFADYLDRHVLATMPAGTKDDVARKYYSAAGTYHELGLTVARELNSPASVSERDAIQLVKNRMQNSQIAAAASQKVNVMADIDTFISNTLSWFEDNRPAQNTVSLAKYVGECRNILKTSQSIRPVLRTYYLWEGTKQLFGNISEKSEILIDNLNSLLHDSNAQKHKDLVEQISYTVPVLSKLIDIAPKLEQLLVHPEGNKSKIISFKDNFVKLQTKLKLLKDTITAAERASESSAKSKVYHLFVSSNFSNARLSIVELNKDISDMIISLSNLEGKSTGTSETGSSDAINFDSVDSESENKNKKENKKENEKNTLNSFKETEIRTLNVWKNKLYSSNIETARKQHINAWLDGQIKELQAANTQEQINKIIEENKKFEAKGII